MDSATISSKSPELGKKKKSSEVHHKSERSAVIMINCVGYWVVHDYLKYIASRCRRKEGDGNGCPVVNH